MSKEGYTRTCTASPCPARVPKLCINGLQANHSACFLPNPPQCTLKGVNFVFQVVSPLLLFQLRPQVFLGKLLRLALSILPARVWYVSSHDLFHDPFPPQTSTEARCAPKLQPSLRRQVLDRLLLAGGEDAHSTLLLSTLP